VILVRSKLNFCIIYKEAKTEAHEQLCVAYKKKYNYITKAAKTISTYNAIAILSPWK
jgi:hypothetical protein